MATKVYAVAESVPVTLNDCPPGLFLFGGKHLGFKTEYVTTLENPRRYQVDAYVVESGEYFHGGAKGPEERGKLLVQPICIEKEAPTPEQTQGAVEAMDVGAIRSHSLRVFARMKQTPHGPKRSLLAEQRIQLSDKVKYAEGWNAALAALKKSEVGHE